MSRQGAVRASVVVPVKNGGGQLQALLDRLAAQQLAGGLETIVIDSGSADGSRERAERAGARVVAIEPREFDHGETRNLGARLARGTALLFLSQDAIPLGRDYARRLVDALEADARLAGVFARQQPRPEADAVTRRELSAWVAGASTPRRVFRDEAFGGLSALERYRLAAFDNVASAARRELLLAHPFESTRFGEDLEWGARMLGLGYGLAYVPEAVVVHSHPRAVRGLYRRNYLGHRLLRRLFGLTTVPDRAHLLRACLGACARDLAELVRGGARLRQVLAAPLQSAAAVYGQYRGARDEARGRPYPGWA